MKFGKAVPAEGKPKKAFNEELCDGDNTGERLENSYLWLER